MKPRKVAAVPPVDAPVSSEDAAVPLEAGRADAVRAMLPSQLIQGGEIIVLCVKPSPWFIVLTSLGWIAWTAAGTALLVQLQLRGFLALERRDIIMLGSALLGARLFWQTLEWLSRTYVLTDRRVIAVAGVLRIRVFECPLPRVQHTSLMLSLRERLLGLGTIGFATAGTAITEVYWAMLAKPLDVHQTVVRTLQRYGR